MKNIHIRNVKNWWISFFSHGDSSIMLCQAFFYQNWRKTKGLAVIAETTRYTSSSVLYSTRVYGEVRANEIHYFLQPRDHCVIYNFLLIVTSSFLNHFVVRDAQSNRFHISHYYLVFYFLQSKLETIGIQNSIEVDKMQRRMDELENQLIRMQSIKERSSGDNLLFL